MKIEASFAAIASIASAATSALRNSYPTNLGAMARLRRVGAIAGLGLLLWFPYRGLAQTAPESGPCLMSCALGGTDPQKPRASDAGYRKFDDLVSFLRARNEKQFAIPTDVGVNESQYVSIGGIEQWITIRGYDRRNPVLLFVHGGPGDVTNPWTFAMFAPWERQFTVVQWDERGSGRTLRRSGPEVASTLKVDRMIQDGIELTEYLRKHLGKDKVIIVCHSFGSILGLGMVRVRPDLFYAYVGTGQVSDETRNYAVAYQALLDKARATANQQAIADLTRVGKPPYKTGEGYAVQRRWANAFEGADQFLPSTFGLTLIAPGSSVEDIDDAADGQLLSADHLVRQTNSMGPNELGLAFSIPMFVFQGAEDFTTPTELARRYEHSIKAPQKSFVAIPGGHFAVFMHSDEFLKELVNRVLPITRHS